MSEPNILSLDLLLPDLLLLNFRTVNFELKGLESLDSPHPPKRTLFRDSFNVDEDSSAKGYR